MIIITDKKLGLYKSDIRIKGVNTYTSVPKKYDTVSARSIFSEYFKEYKKRAKLIGVE
jgi:hypothetical protein